MVSKISSWSNLTNIFQMGWNHQLVITGFLGPTVRSSDFTSENSSNFDPVTSALPMSNHRIPRNLPRKTPAHPSELRSGCFSPGGKKKARGRKCGSGSSFRNFCWFKGGVEGGDVHHLDLSCFLQGEFVYSYCYKYQLIFVQGDFC